MIDAPVKGVIYAESMEVAFDDQSLDQLETDPKFTGGFGDALVSAYRRAILHIRAASDERTLYARRSFRFEKLSGDREGQHSMRLNDQWRLIVKIAGDHPRKTIRVIEIVDYH
ncbi:type II toxin-antitoxin system RelE/ParE family toxin [Mesorhizobium sp. M0437]|uniref:type II toxin-antitoxin system RelE/ParE family toxin n=1 Tax=Mesorhizobium sp. M0437 TaxID=2956945 RepID=UPI003334EE2B